MNTDARIVDLRLQFEELRNRPRGHGRLKLQSLCRAYGIDVEMARRVLKKGQKSASDRDLEQLRNAFNAFREEAVPPALRDVRAEVTAGGDAVSVAADSLWGELSFPDAPRDVARSAGWYVSDVGAGFPAYVDERRDRYRFYPDREHVDCWKLKVERELRLVPVGTALESLEFGWQSFAFDTSELPCFSRCRSRVLVCADKRPGPGADWRPAETRAVSVGRGGGIFEAVFDPELAPGTMVSVRFELNVTRAYPATPAQFDAHRPPRVLSGPYVSLPIGFALPTRSYRAELSFDPLCQIPKLSPVANFSASNPGLRRHRLPTLRPQADDGTSPRTLAFAISRPPLGVTQHLRWRPGSRH